MSKKYYIRDFPVKIQNVLAVYWCSGKHNTNRYPFEWLKVIAEENLLNTPELQIELAAFLLSSAKIE